MTETSIKETDSGSQDFRTAALHDLHALLDQASGHQASQSSESVFHLHCRMTGLKQ